MHLTVFEIRSTYSILNLPQCSIYTGFYGGSHERDRRRVRASCFAQPARVSARQGVFVHICRRVWLCILKRTRSVCGTIQDKESWVLRVGGGGGVYLYAALQENACPCLAHLYNTCQPLLDTPTNRSLLPHAFIRRISYLHLNHADWRTHARCETHLLHGVLLARDTGYGRFARPIL